MAGARSGKGGNRNGGSRSFKGGVGNAGSGNGNSGAGCGGTGRLNGGARSVNGDVSSGNNGACPGGTHSGNDGGSGKRNSGAGCGGADSVTGGAHSGNDGTGDGSPYRGIGGTRGRIPLHGGRPPIQQARAGTGKNVVVRGEFSDSDSDGTGKGVRIRNKGSQKAVRTRGNTTYTTRCGRHTIQRGGHSGNSSLQGRAGNRSLQCHAGSSSRAGSADPLADMCGVLREQSTREITNHHNEDEDFGDDADLEDSDQEVADHPSSQHNSHVGASRDTFEARVIRRAGHGFQVEHGDVHKSITRILAEHHDGAWLTFRQIPRDVLGRMFDCFRTRWRWDPAYEEAMREGFINVLKDRYRDIMRQMRVKSTQMACAVRQDMDPNNYKQFAIIRDYPPDSMAIEVWRDLCARWNTSGWLKKSESGSKNRKSGDSNGTSSRHTGGSMGYAERRARMKRRLNEEPNFKQIFLETHLTKECKKKLWAGDIDIYNLKELTFCTDRARKAYADYLDAMRDVYGEDFHEYPDDPQVWASVQAEGRTHRVYGIGSSDLNYLVTGTSSSSVGSAPTYAEYKQSQEEVEVMRTQMVDLEARLEEERKAREELQKQFQEFMKNWRAPDN